MRNLVLILFVLATLDSAIAADVSIEVHYLTKQDRTDPNTGKCAECGLSTSERSTEFKYTATDVEFFRGDVLKIKTTGKTIYLDFWTHGGAVEAKNAIENHVSRIVVDYWSYWTDLNDGFLNVPPRNFYIIDKEGNFMSLRQLMKKID